MISINAGTRQFTIPGADLTFGVEADNGTERKHFQCPRYVGDNFDVASCFVRINYRNANGETDSYLVDDLAVDGTNVTFSWLLHPKVTAYKGQVKFVMCLVGPDLKLKWHTTQGTGQVMEGLEPDNSHVEDDTADVVAALIAMVEAQTTAVEATGAEQVQIVRSAAETASASAVAEIEAKRANSLASIPADYTSLSSSVEKLARSVAPGIECDVEGEAITLNDASNNYLRGLRIFGRSTQNGTPTPDKPVDIVSVDKPVVGVYGKNYATVEDIVVQNYPNEATVTIDGNRLALHTRQYGDGFHFGLGTMKAGKTYIISGNALNHTNIRIYNINILDTSYQEITVDADGDFSVEYTPPTNYQTVRVWVGQETVCVLTNFLICQKSLNTGYEQPTKQTVSLSRSLSGITVTSGGNYTDSNGQQWICDEVDMERGVYVQRVDRKVFTGAGTDWRQYDTKSLFMITWSGVNGGWEQGHAIATHFINDTAAYTESEGCFAIDQKGLCYFSTKHETLDEFKAWLSENPVTVVCELANPIETPLSETELAAYRSLHTNKPNTTILNNSGAHMAVKYTADTKLYIDKKIKELA